MHGAKRHAGRGKATRLLGGFGGMLPPRKFLKMVQFGAFWSIFSCNFVKKICKNVILYTKVIDIVLLGTIFRGIAAYSPECVFIVLKTGSPAWGAE